MKRLLRFFTLSFAASCLCAQTSQETLRHMQGGNQILGSGAGTVFSQIANVKYYGAVGNGIHDDTAAIQAAINSFPNGNGVVYLPNGTYLTTSEITIAQNRINLIGDGTYATEILFAPTATQTCLLFQHAGGVPITQVRAEGFTIYSNDTTYTKTAMNLVDVDVCIFDNIAIGGSNSGGWIGANSIGIQTNGRDLTTISRITDAADRPIVIGPNPDANISIDHFHFSDLYLLGSGNPNVEILTGVNLTQVTFDGFEAWVVGTYGLYWNDTTTTGVSNGLVLANIRTEQSTAPTDYAVYIVHNTGLQQLNIRNCNFGANQGVYLRNVYQTTLQNVEFPNTATSVLDVTSSDSGINIQNCFFQAGTTASMVGQRQVWGSPLDPNTGALPPSAVYDLSSNALNALTTSFISVANKGTFTLSSGAASLTGLVLTTSSVLVPTLKTASGTIAGLPYLTAINVGAGTATVAGGGSDNSTYNYVIQN